ncbi:Uncharacterised protein [Bordetella pertussis]|nr:Uncharacterised protein [Bordetella pertussis]
MLTSRRFSPKSNDSRLSGNSLPSTSQRPLDLRSATKAGSSARSRTCIASSWP